MPLWALLSSSTFYFLLGVIFTIVAIGTFGGESLLQPPSLRAPSGATVGDDRSVDQQTIGVKHKVRDLSSFYARPRLVSDFCSLPPSRSRRATTRTWLTQGPRTAP